MPNNIPPLISNDPFLWSAYWPFPTDKSHKYSRGSALVLAGPPWQTGASRLAARAALRVGAGAVTIAAPKTSLPVLAAHLTSVMLQPCDTPDELADALILRRPNALLLGPGFTHLPHHPQQKEETRAFVSSLFLQNQSLIIVLDADALTAFEHHLDEFCLLLRNAPGPVILTPHEGEFTRLFGMQDQSRPTKCLHAAQMTNAIVLLKGAGTLVAHPEGRVAQLNLKAPFLATAGSGDVLAGFITGLCAQGMPAFEATCAAAWIHATLGATLGPGLIAEDLPEALPSALKNITALS